MKTIKTVTREEVQYVDDNGEEKSIDLVRCNQNLQANMRKSGEMDSPYVGWRDVCAIPPYIIFATDGDLGRQNLKLEFASSTECNVTDERYWTLLTQLKRVGWRTFDLS